jgi:hypothetical protein
MCFLYVPSLYAQSSGIGSWNILNVKYTHNKQWSFFSEAQVRSLKFYSNFHYYEYKAGVNFKVHPHLTLSVGAGSYQTYKEGGDFRLPKNNDEFRLWPQLVLSQSSGRIKTEHRYRAEARYTSNGYRNRFRYRVGVSYPFGKERSGYRPFQLSASNELFFTDREPYFERNRLHLACHFKPSAGTTWQVGYIHQFDYRINDETGRDFFQIGYFIELYRKTAPRTTNDAEIKDY